MDFLDIVKSELKFQKHLLRQFNVLRRIKDDGQLFCQRKSNGYTNYYIKEKTGGQKHYVRKKNRKRNAAGLHASGKRFGHICS